MQETGFVKTEINNKIGTITFGHPKSNSLPKHLLIKLEDAINKLAADNNAAVIVLKSEGENTFCAGASFDELKAIGDAETGKDFFMGFARLILAMKKCPKFIITRVQGKAVGGGVGIIAASDYVFGLVTAQVKLSELNLGIGPFVVGPVIQRKTGIAAYSAMSIDTSWYDADWALKHGLFSSVQFVLEDVDKAVNELAEKLAGSSPEAMAILKSLIWQDTEHWDKLLEERAEISGRLILSGFAKNYINSFKNG
jgi:methylglutaconyl-CoA hydratase